MTILELTKYLAATSMLMHTQYGTKKWKNTLKANNIFIYEYIQIFLRFISFSQGIHTVISWVGRVYPDDPQGSSSPTACVHTGLPKIQTMFQKFAGRKPCSTPKWPGLCPGALGTVQAHRHRPYHGLSPASQGLGDTEETKAAGGAAEGTDMACQGNKQTNKKQDALGKHCIYLA